MAEVVLINCFEVPAGREDVFLALPSRVDGFRRAAPGDLR
jgi:hypothetical protein